MNQGEEPPVHKPHGPRGPADTIRRALAERQAELAGNEPPFPRPAGERPAGPPPADGAGGETAGSIEPPVEGSAAISYGAYARAIVTARARIGNHLDPTLFSDPAFDILLDLLASGEEGRKVSMSSCAYAARIARTTALRWICLLEKKGLVERVADDEDHRATLVRLTPEAKASLIRYLQQVARKPRPR